MRTRFAALVATPALVAMLAACGSTPIATPIATPLPSPVATVSAAPTGVTDLVSMPRGTLAAGTYLRSDFHPALTFTVDSGWQAIQAVSGFYDVEQDPGSLDVIAVQFARPTSWADASAALAGLPATPGVTVSDAQDVTMGGLPGYQVVLTADNGDLEAQRFVPVLDVPAGSLSIGSGRRLQISLVDTADGLLAILVGGSVRHWDATLAAATPVLRSIAFR